MIRDAGGTLLRVLSALASHARKKTAENGMLSWHLGRQHSNLQPDQNLYSPIVATSCGTVVF